MLEYDNINMIGDDNVRYVLEKKGDNPLVVIGINPSTADKVSSDRTIDKLRVYCDKWGYDSFIMLNLYPLRATKPEELPSEIDSSIFNRNIKYILEYTESNDFPILFAYGDLAGFPKYIRICRDKIIEIFTKQPSKRFLCLGSLTNKGNPRHPSRLSYNIELSTFSLPKI